MANQPNDAVEKLRLGAWLPFGGDASEAQDGVAWPREAKEVRDALVAFGEEAAAAAVRLVEKCAARGGWAAPATGCRATLNAPLRLHRRAGCEPGDLPGGDYG